MPPLNAGERTTRTTDKGLQDLKTWTLGQRSFCEGRFGITSQDQGLADRWPQSLPDCGYVPMDTLVQDGRVFADAAGYVYELDPATGKQLNYLPLPTYVDGAPSMRFVTGLSTTLNRVEVLATGTDGSLYRNCLDSDGRQDQDRADALRTRLGQGSLGSKTEKDG